VQQALFSAHAGDPSRTALALKELTPRTRALLARRDKLLRSIARRQADIARLTETLRGTATRLGFEGPLLFREVGRLSKSIAEMFEALAKSPARSKRERKQIAAMYHDLAESGLLATIREAEDLESMLESVGHAGNRPEFVEPAAGPAANANGGPARLLFRRLADLLHPDKVQDESEKARRTEVMKQVTQAYQSGDYGRLVEIEQSQGSAQERANGLESDDYDKELLATNEALQRQSRELDKKLRTLRAEGAGDLEQSLEQVKRIVGVLGTIHDFVARFRNGEINFQTFMAGPANLDLEGLLPEGMFDEQDEAEALTDVLDQMLSELAGSAPLRRQARHRGHRRG
jgi:hypothetical protein